MPEKRILLIGPQGQVGWELLRCILPLGQVFAVSRSSTEQGYAYLDLTDLDSIRSVVQEVKPAVILNAAAYTAVDKAEQEPELAYQINAHAVRVLAEQAQQLGALLVHYSTDYVFNGQQQLYQEHDEVQPVNVYGASKLAGEQAIQAVGGHYLILRTAWVYSLRGKNFLLTIQRLAQERSELNIVADQMGAPTWSRMIAEATAQILAQIDSPLAPKTELNALSGIYHLTCGGQTSWYEFAKAIIAQMEKQPQVNPVTTADYPTPAKRPSYSVLANEKIKHTFGIQLPSWDKALELCLTTYST